MAVDDVLLDAEERMEKAVEVLHDELRTIRTGRASTGLVENLKVDYYGAPTPLKSLANIATPQATLITIRPFDPNSLKDIEKAILASDIGITPSSDGKIIRLAVPPLSEERRKQLVQQTKHLAEETKVALRNVRRDGIKDLEAQEKGGEITEDDLHRAKDDVQELIHQYETKVDDLIAKKTEELMEV